MKARCPQCRKTIYSNMQNCECGKNLSEFWSSYRPQPLPLALIFSFVGIVTLSVVTMKACSGMCGGEVASEVLSPSKNLKAVIYNYDCGATTGYDTRIGITAATTTFDAEMTPILGFGTLKEPSIHWISESEIEISVDGISKRMKVEPGIFGISATPIH